MTAISARESYTPTILIVDDTPANLAVIVEGLEDRGFRIIVAEDGVEGLHRADLARPDLILLDVMMPGPSGFETCRRLKALGNTCDIPVIFMTSLTDTEDKVAGFNAGGVDYVTKPLEINEVIARVSTHLSLHAMRKQLEAKNALLQQEILERRKAEDALETSRELIRRQRDALKSLYDDIVAEQKISERLLLNLLPGPIAARLKTRSELLVDGPPEVIADSFSEATVLFADIVQFTRFSAGMKPEQLVAVLNEIFTEFDGIADNRGLEKIKTIGDAYLAAAGLPVPAADHAMRAAHMALDMIESLARFNERRGYGLQMRIGINSGPLVAGVIGRRKFSYDLWGDAVNIASRMESQGVAGRVQITESTRRLLGEAFLLEDRGTIPAKGTGQVHTWFLLGRTGASSNETGTPPHGAEEGGVNQTHARFLALWSRCGGIGAEAVYADLMQHYAEPNRHYHTLRHIRRCLRDLDWARAAIPDPDAVELALWCHDVIYVPGARDNEQLSARWFKDCAQGRIAASERIANMILATTHAMAPDDPDARFTVDIDLANLGGDRTRFFRDQVCLRAERRDLDDIAFDCQERAFLSFLLARSHVYHTDVFRARCETPARNNLAWRLAQPAPG